MERLQDAARSFAEWWNGQQLLVRGGMLGAAGLVIGALAAGVILVGGSGAPAPVAARTPTVVVSAPETPTPTPDAATATPTTVVTPAPTPTPTASPTPEPTASPEPAIGNIEELVSQYGHPAGYDFARLRIPLIGVDAPVGPSLVDGSAGAQMHVPEGPATTFWYDLSEWTGLGGVPGQGGNAIFSGHADLESYVPYAGVNYRGPAVFAGLHLLSPGDRIFVDYNGETLEYVVQWKEQIKAGNSERWGQIWSANVPVDSITIYTCGGEFDDTERSYIDRVVVRAERA